MGWEEKAKCPEMIPLAMRLRSLRDEKGWSQGKLGEALTPSAPTLAGVISSWERASKRPTADTLLKLADIFGVTVDYLLGRTDTRTNDPDVIDSLDVIEDLLIIYFNGEFAYQGYIAIDNQLVDYWRKIQTAVDAGNRMGLSGELLLRIVNSIRDEYVSALSNPDPRKRKFTRFDFMFHEEYETYTDLVKDHIRELSGDEKGGTANVNPED